MPYLISLRDHYQVPGSTPRLGSEQKCGGWDGWDTLISDLTCQQNKQAKTNIKNWYQTSELHSVLSTFLLAEAKKAHTGMSLDSLIWFDCMRSTIWLLMFLTMTQHFAQKRFSEVYQQTWVSNSNAFFTSKIPFWRWNFLVSMLSDFSHTDSAMWSSTHGDFQTPLRKTGGECELETRGQKVHRALFSTLQSSGRTVMERGQYETSAHWTYSYLQTDTKPLRRCSHSNV